MESEKLNMTAVYHYWYKVWMEDSESWVYRDDTGELDVCCGEKEVYDKVYEHLRTGAFAYPAIGIGFKILDVRKIEDNGMLYSVNIIFICERGGHVEEWEEEVKVVANTPYKVESTVEKYVNDNIKTADMQNLEWIIEKVEKLN